MPCYICSYVTTSRIRVAVQTKTQSLTPLAPFCVAFTCTPRLHREYWCVAKCTARALKVNPLAHTDKKCIICRIACDFAARSRERKRGINGASFVHGKLEDDAYKHGHAFIEMINVMFLVAFYMHFAMHFVIYLPDCYRVLVACNYATQCRRKQET